MVLSNGTVSSFGSSSSFTFISLSLINFVKISYSLLLFALNPDKTTTSGLSFFKFLSKNSFNCPINVSSLSWSLIGFVSDLKKSSTLPESLTNTPTTALSKSPLPKVKAKTFGFVPLSYPYGVKGA